MIRRFDVVNIDDHDIIGYGNVNVNLMQILMNYRYVNEFIVLQFNLCYY